MVDAVGERHLRRGRQGAEKQSVSADEEPRKHIAF
jgi:hypothetical protein